MKLNRADTTVVIHARSMGMNYSLHFQGNHLFMNVGYHTITPKHIQKFGKNRRHTIVLEKDYKGTHIPGQHIFKVRRVTSNPFRKNRLPL